jgi:hypothetical protein
MKKTIVLLVLFAIVLPACSGQPSEDAIQTAIAETALANPTKTIQPTSTNTSTPPPTATATFTVTPSPTPDLRIINGVPRDFQLQREDLPPEGKYYLPNSTWTSPHTNAEVTAGWTVAKGKEYLERTGRITGWWTAFARGTSKVSMPEELYCAVIQYQTVEGAQISLVEYDRASRAPELNIKDKDIELNLGDLNEVQYRYKDENVEVKTIVYYIDFSYKNYLVNCYGYGLEPDVSHEFMENIARIMLNKLKSAELIMPPTVTPTITVAP